MSSNTIMFLNLLIPHTLCAVPKIVYHYYRYCNTGIVITKGMSYDNKIEMQKLALGCRIRYFLLVYKVYSLSQGRNDSWNLAY